MAQTLNHSSRPRSLDAMVGQDKLVARLRAHMASGRIPKGLLFTGPTGTGKTTLARIIALALQCTHQTVWGNPCKACRAIKSSFDIFEINAAKIRGIRELEAALEGSDYAPRMGAYRIYIIDEVHRSTPEAQDLALKYLEDSPESTLFILCSTKPEKVIETLQGRCLCYQLKELRADNILLLVERLLKKINSKLPADRLVDVLVENGVSYPRHITHAVEKYAAGAEPEEAAIVEASAVIDVKAVTSAIVKGDWEGVARYLHKVQASDIRQIRLSCLAYLRVILLQSPEISERTATVADGILELTKLSNMEDLAVSAGLASVLYRITSMFADYKH